MMMQQKSGLYVFVLIASLLLPCCSPAAGVTPTMDAPTYPEVTAGYPYPNLPVEGSPAPLEQIQAIEAYPIGEINVQEPYPDSTQINIHLPPDPPASAPEPEEGKASISGALYAYGLGDRIAGTVVYLTLAAGDQKDQVPNLLVGPRQEFGDISFSTDEKGNFELNNVPAGNYFLVVWSPYTWQVAQVSQTDEKALLIELKADQKKVLGTIMVGWP